MAGSNVAEKYRVGLILFFVVAMTAVSSRGLCDEPGWPDIRTRLLPDECFAALETEKGGKILRRCPHHDINGHLDVDQLIFVLGTLNEIDWRSKRKKIDAREHLERHYSQYLNDIAKIPNPYPVDINRAPLRDMVLLPGIGPILAVRIFQYRENQRLFSDPQDILNVEGIGKSTFRAIRHYITCR